MDWDWQIRTKVAIKLIWRLPPKDIAKGRHERYELQERLNAMARTVLVSLHGELISLIDLDLAGGEMTDSEFVAAVESAGLSVQGKE